MIRVAALLLALSTLLASPASADGWSGVWSVEGGGTRTLARREEGRLGLQLEWPGRGPVTVAGAGFEDRLSLSCQVTDGRGMVQALAGERRTASRRVLELRGQRQRLADGAEVVEVRLVEGGTTEVACERWRRDGPPKLEVVRVTPARGWAPLRDGPCKVRLRVSGARATARLLVVADTRGRDELEPRRREFHDRCERLDRDRALPIVHARSLGTLAPGEHDVEWDGRDDACRRLPLGGDYLLVVDGGRVDGAPVRGQAALTIERPGAAYLGSNWPRIGDLASLDWTTGHAAFRGGVRGLGYADPAENPARVERSRVFEALRTNAFVVVATHGQTDHFELYAGPGEPAYVRASHLAGERLDDLHTVILWACLTGKHEPAGEKVEARHGTPKAGVPAALRRAGADVVVSFATIVYASHHAEVVASFFETALEPKDGRAMPIGDAMRAAAAAADALKWKPASVEDQAKWRARGIAPMSEAARITCADGIELSEPLNPARWGDPSR